jgi:hypothetical protein
MPDSAPVMKDEAGVEGAEEDKQDEDQVRRSHTPIRPGFILHHRRRIGHCLIAPHRLR